MSNLQQELLITITGRVPLPAGLFEQARVIAGVEDKIIALRQTAGSVDGIDFQVDAQVVAAGAEPEQPEPGQPETAEQAATRRKRRTKAEMEAARAAEAAAQQQGGEQQPAAAGEQQIDLEEAIAAQGVPTGAVATQPATGGEDFGIIPTQPAPAPQPVATQPPAQVAAPAKAPPPWAKKSEPAPAQYAPPAAAPEPAAQQPVAAGRIPVLKADGTVFSSYASIENAEAKMIELINACTAEPELDSLMTVNEQVCEWPMAVRERVYNAAQEREAALVAAAKAGA